jgi:hypothetical protein
MEFGGKIIGSYAFIIKFEYNLRFLFIEYFSIHNHGKVFVFPSDYKGLGDELCQESTCLVAATI